MAQPGASTAEYVVYHLECGSFVPIHEEALDGVTYVALVRLDAFISLLESLLSDVELPEPAVTWGARIEGGLDFALCAEVEEFLSARLVLAGNGILNVIKDR